MIRVLVVDDHPALRTGLVALLRAEPGIVPVAAAADADSAAQEARRHSPDVVLADYHLGDGDGLSLCLRLKSQPQPPRVLIYTAFAGDALGLAAAVAGADGLTDKGARANDLFDALRAVAAGQTTLPPRSPETLEAVSARLAPEDLPVLGMRLDQTPVAEIAEVLGVAETEIGERLNAMLAKIRGPRAALR